MTSSAEDRFVGGGGGERATQHGGAGRGGGEEQRLLMLQSCYHVPQHSRREKLRFPAEESSPPPLYPAGNSLTAAAAFLPSSSFQFDAHGEVVVPSPHAQHQIPGGGQGFSLSLASPRPPAPRPPLASRPPAPLGPFTGYAAVLSRSRFLEPARKLLEEVCGRAAPGQQQPASGRGSDAAREMLLEAYPEGESPPGDHGMEQQWRKTRLISMLDEVYRRYRQYYQQVQAVITSFESVAGLSTAAPFASMALKLMSKHFRCLKNAISTQLRRTTTKDLGNSSLLQESISSFELLNGSSYHHQIRTANNTAGSFSQPHAWRPQRGLPERAVSVLRAWLFDHFLHPYPTDVDKQNLARQTGLTRNQVSNWFINARVRLWKPMVEEVHSLEMRKKNKTSAAAAGNEIGNRDERLLRPLPSSFDCYQQFQIARAQSSQYPAAPRSIRENAGGGTGGGNGVSLTLGLHQNGGGGCFGGPLDPINVARRLGLDDCNDTYSVSALGGQERQFEKDDSSRLLRDFVG